MGKDHAQRGRRQDKTFSTGRWWCGVKMFMTREKYIYIMNISHRVCVCMLKPFCCCCCMEVVLWHGGMIIMSMFSPFHATTTRVVDRYTAAVLLYNMLWLPLKKIHFLRYEPCLYLHCIDLVCAFSERVFSLYSCCKLHGKTRMGSLLRIPM